MQPYRHRLDIQLHHTQATRMAIKDWSDNIILGDLQDDPQFSDDLNALSDLVQRRNQVDVVLDFSGVTYLNSSNIAKLLKLRKLLVHSPKPGKLKLCAINTSVWACSCDRPRQDFRLLRRRADRACQRSDESLICDAARPRGDCASNRFRACMIGCRFRPTEDHILMTTVPRAHPRLLAQSLPWRRTNGGKKLRGGTTSWPRSSALPRSW